MFSLGCVVRHGSSAGSSGSSVSFYPYDIIEETKLVG